MLRELISEVLTELEYTKDDMSEKVENIITVLKDSAKKLFFEGKINDLKDYLYGEKSESASRSEQVLKENLAAIGVDAEELVSRLRLKIETKLDELKKEKNIDSLLDLLDYGHLKGFLSMFK